MKKMLSVILSWSLLLTPVNTTCFAKTYYDSQYCENKEQRVIRENNDKPIIINNNISARADAKAEAGNSKFLGLLKLLVGLVGIYAAAKIINQIVDSTKEAMAPLISAMTSLINKKEADSGQHSNDFKDDKEHNFSTDEMQSLDIFSMVLKFVKSTFVSKFSAESLFSKFSTESL